MHHRNCLVGLILTEKLYYEYTRPRTLFLLARLWRASAGAQEMSSPRLL
jgi:hypothetical protein